VRGWRRRIRLPRASLHQVLPQQPQAPRQVPPLAASFLDQSRSLKLPVPVLAFLQPLVKGVVEVREEQAEEAPPAKKRESPSTLPLVLGTAPEEAPNIEAAETAALGQGACQGRPHRPGGGRGGGPLEPSGQELGETI
jgi:hypothetical protein